jgi:hypothetical protein
MENRKNSDSTFAFKGGHYKKDLLAKLNIPSVNLEWFGYPKAEKLFDKLIWLEMRKVEVEAYALWMRKS